MRVFSLFFLVFALFLPTVALSASELLKVEVIESHAREGSRMHRLPQSVLVAGDKGEAGVYLVDEDSTVVFLPVQAAMRRKGWVEVTGLPEIAKVLIQNENTPLPGTVVDPHVGKAIIPMRTQVNIPPASEQ